MSNANVSNPTTTASGNQAAAATGRSQAGKRTTGQDAAPGDLFSSLLALAAASEPATATLAGTDLPDDSATEEATDGSAPLATEGENPLFALLAWNTALPTAPAGSGTVPTPDTDGGGAGGATTTVPDTLATGAEPGASAPGLQAVKAEPAPSLAAAASTAPASTAAPVETPVADTKLATPPTPAEAARRAPGTEAVATTAQWARNSSTTGSQRTNQLQTEASRSRTAAASGSAPRSTVALNERYGASKALESSLSGPTAATATATAAVPTGPNAEPGAPRPGTALPGAAEAGAPAAGAGGLDVRESARGGTGDADPPNGLGQDGSGTPDAAGADAPDLNTWSNQGVRHASLRVGQGGDNPIDVRLSLADQQVNVDFRTDSPDARNQLQHNASQSLGDLLERNGLQLGQVSVGAQNQQQERAPQQQSPTRGPTDARDSAGTAGAESPRAAPAAPGLRADGSRPLDLFV